MMTFTYTYMPIHMNMLQYMHYMTYAIPMMVHPCMLRYRLPASY